MSTAGLPITVARFLDVLATLDAEECAALVRAWHRVPRQDAHWRHAEDLVGDAIARKGRQDTVTRAHDYVYAIVWRGIAAMAVGSAAAVIEYLAATVVAALCVADALPAGALAILRAPFDDLLASRTDGITQDDGDSLGTYRIDRWAMNDDDFWNGRYT